MVQEPLSASADNIRRLLVSGETRCTLSRSEHLLVGRHAERHEPEDPCPGCQPCPEPLCRCCGRAHAVAACPRCLGKIREDLDAMEALWPRLSYQAMHGSVRGQLVAAGPIPGGEATYVLAPFTRVVLEDQLPSHPLQILTLWADAWRDWFGQPTSLAPTVSREADYLRGILGIRVQVEADAGAPRIELMKRIIHKARLRLEDIVHAGEREHTTPTPCLNCSARLVKRYASSEDADGYWCQRCRTSYTPNQYEQARARWMHHDGAARYIRICDAVLATGRSEWTIRSWAARMDIASACDLMTKRVLVWWPDVRDRDAEVSRRS